MRSNIVFVILIIMLGGFVAGLVLRSRSPHTTPVLATASASTSANPAVSGGTAAASASGSASNSAATSKPALGRPLRVISLGWELLAPGIMANDGADPGKKSLFKKAGLELKLNAVNEVAKLENALARGGADEKGADIALLPLQRFVASYERLKALNPVIFFVVSWSDGRDVVLSKLESFQKLPKRGDVRLRGVAGAAASFVGLFALDLAGVSVDRVKIVEKKGDISAITRREAKRKSEQASGNILLTTGEASRLVPLVAIAQASLVDKQRGPLTTWAKLWLQGNKLVAGEASVAARKIAAVKGAPEPLQVLSRLSEIAPASLAENAHAAGLSGRGAVTLEALFQRSWRIWRDAKVLTIPPEKAPVDGSIIATLVRANTELAAPESSGTKDGVRSKDKPLVVHRAPKGKLDEDKVVNEIGFIAGVFRRSPLRISVHPRHRVDDKLTTSIIERAVDRFGLAQSRLLKGKARPTGGATATIEVMPVP